MTTDARTKAARALLLIPAGLLASAALGFTQGGAWYGAATPQGHEWLTVHAGLAVLGQEASTDARLKARTFVHAEDLSVPAHAVSVIKQHPLDETTYGSRYQAVAGAVFGQRWVDLAGFSLLKNMFSPSNATSENCWFGVAQDPDHVQHDHFLRQSDEPGGDGAVRAIRDSIARFQRYFVYAAIAGHVDGEKITAWDGGMEKQEIVADRNYFYFGRAVHLFQDSFSPEHGMRSAAEGYKKLHGIKTFVCTKGSDEHSKLDPLSVKRLWSQTSAALYGAQGPRDLDIIFTSVGTGHTAAGLTDPALAALEASKDLWAAFFRVMSVPRKDRKAAALKAADRLSRYWMSMDEAEVKARQLPAGHSPGKCEKDQVKIKAALRKCLYNIVPKAGSDYDPSLHLPYHWERKHDLYFSVPPASWKPF